MSIGLLTILLFLSILVVFAIGTPVGFGLGAIAMIFGAIFWGPQSFQILPHTAISSISSFTLLAIPLFIFMGMILERSGIGEAMFKAMHLLTGRLKGGVAIGVIAVCSMIAAMVGIMGAGIMTAGSIALPAMFKRGYNKYLALGSVMAGGGLGILIPPSLTMILFSSITKTSVGQMFAGGIVPGFLMSGAFMLYIAIRCTISPEMGPVIPEIDRGDIKEKIIAARDAVLAFALISVVLGSIFFGAATPTEASAIGALGAIAITIIYRRFRLRVLTEASIGSMRLTAVFVWILIGAQTFSNFHMFMGAGRLVSELIETLQLGPWGVMILMQLSMILMGCIMDEYIVVLICAPLYTPIAISLGFDPIWFGVLMIINMEIAIQTPPYGFALFYLKAVAPKDITMMDIYKSIAPFVAIKFVILVLCMAFPHIILWLPHLLFR